MIAAQRFTVSCSAASATATARDDIARTKNNFIIAHPLLRQCLLQRMYFNAIGQAKSGSQSHEDVTAVYVVNPPDIWMTLDVKPNSSLYSVRSAVIGFTRVARFAGKKQAR